MYTSVIKQIKIVDHNFVFSINKKSRKRANGLFKGATRELTDTVVNVLIKIIGWSPGLKPVARGS